MLDYSSSCSDEPPPLVYVDSSDDEPPPLLANANRTRTCYTDNSAARRTAALANAKTPYKFSSARLRYAVFDNRAAWHTAALANAETPFEFSHAHLDYTASLGPEKFEGRFYNADYMSPEFCSTSSGASTPTLRNLARLIFTIIFSVLIALLGSQCLLPSAVPLITLQLRLLFTRR